MTKKPDPEGRVGRHTKAGYVILTKDNMAKRDARIFEAVMQGETFSQQARVVGLSNENVTRVVLKSYRKWLRSRGRLGYISVDRKKLAEIRQSWRDANG